MNAFHLLPVAASTLASRVDAIFLTLFAVTGAVALAVACLIVYFVIRYRKGATVDRSQPPAGERWLEVTWIVLPLLVFFGFFGWAAWTYTDLEQPPADAMPIFVVGKQWMWKLQHSNGRREIDELHVPLGRPVQLILTSQDVIHSFYVPAFRVKQDAVPGRYTSLWFTATHAGSYPLFCAEYCGSQHAGMGGQVVVMEPAAFSQWLAAGNSAPELAAVGAERFRYYGCSGCHAVDANVHAPDLRGIWGRQVHLADGRTVTADARYLRDSILLPRQDVVAGYAPIMPSYQGRIGEEDLTAILEFLRSAPDKATGG